MSTNPHNHHCVMEGTKKTDTIQCCLICRDHYHNLKTNVVTDK